MVMYDPIKDVHRVQDVTMRDVSPDYDVSMSESTGADVGLRQGLEPREDRSRLPDDESARNSITAEIPRASWQHDRPEASSMVEDQDDSDADDEDEAAAERQRMVKTGFRHEESSSISEVDTEDFYHESLAESSHRANGNGRSNGHARRQLDNLSGSDEDESESQATEGEWQARARAPTSERADIYADSQDLPPTTRARNDPMSISAMLSGPPEDDRPPTARTAIKTPKQMAKLSRKISHGEFTPLKRGKAQSEADTKRKRENRKSKGLETQVPRMDDLSDASEELEISDEEDYRELKDKFREQWQQTCARLVATEQLAHRRRAAEVTGRLLYTLDRRIRKTQKSFENRHYREALLRATHEETIRKEQQRRDLAASRQAAKAQAAIASMAPPSTSKKLTKRQRRQQAAADARARAQADAAADDIANRMQTAVGAEQIEAIQDSIWNQIARKEIPKVHRIIQTGNANRNMNLKKTGQLCAKEARRWQFRTNKTAKDMQAKSKRAMREMLIFWKRNERGDMLNRQKAEKEIIDRAKKDEEDRESRRQSRKLNFLITQTELYSHFIGNKVKTAEAEQSEDTSGDARLQMTEQHPSMPINMQGADESLPSKELDFDADDDDALRAAAARNAQEAVEKAKQKAQGFDTESGARKHQLTGDAQADADAMNLDFQNPTTIGDTAISQPRMLNATLKEYQLKGLNWLVNLYEQGINGILADEMGLGKTVQSISVMAHLAETYNIWGPFLVIAPASTLHNWQQEITKFVPRLKALPYWGNTKDRKVLRKFWDRKRATYTEDAPFHVVITSYQLVVQDSQYFQNVKWQYMILDEAQAIKSSQSTRWKNLLAFKCRNRLLLTGTPIQNTMQELWALLHFIMPSLFDSHNEFSEWFSKDIENHAQKNSELNEEQLKRLHMILKPFMLRRVKKNVQKELGDKIELDVFCDLNMRQRGLYSFLRREISMKDILEKATSDRDADLSSLMNLVMQLRKVCNHPDLFERADVRAPLALVDMPKTANIAKEGRELEVKHASTSAVKYHLPKFIYREGGMLNVPSEHSKAGFRMHCLRNLMNIYAPENVYKSSLRAGGAFAWSRYADHSPSEVYNCRNAPIESRIRELQQIKYEPSTSGLPQCVRALFKMNTPSQAIATETSPHGVMNTLLSVYKSVPRNSGHHRIEPVYDPAALAPSIEVLCPDRTFVVEMDRAASNDQIRRAMYGLSLPEESAVVSKNIYPDPLVLPHGMLPSTGQDKRGYNSIRMPSMQTFITDSGKLSKLDELLTELKKNDHRVLLYFQMTKMIDLMEEYLVYRQYKYLRLDGSSKISDRRDMVNDWQTRPELFVFLLSTRAGGLGINLTAADTVIFYDSDWNPTIDSQAMDRAHRLGQTKQVTVYRLITRGTIEERILSRAKEKEEVQKVVISGGDYKQGTTDNIQFQAQKGGGRDVVSWLLEDDDQIRKVSQQLDSLPARSKKSGKARQGPTLDDMYHEGENKMESENHSPEPEAEADEPARKKKKLGTKKKPRIQEL